MPSNATIATGSFASAKFGQGLQSGRASAASLPTQTAFTVEAWFSTTSGDNPNVLASQPGVFWMGLVAGKPSFTIEASGDGNQNTAANTFNDGAWHHMGLVLGATGCRLYVDGAQVATRSAFSSAAANFSANSFFPVSYSNFTFNGLCDEVAVFSGERYTANFTPPTSAYTGGEANLLRLYHLNGDGADTAGATATPTPTPTPTPSTTVYARDSAAIYYSPGNWCDDGTSRITPNTGAYLKTVLNGTSLVMLTTAIDLGGANYPRMVVIVDGIAFYFSLTTATRYTIVNNLPSGAHTVEVHMEASDWRASNGAGWWDGSNAWKVTGFEVPSGETLSAPTIRPYIYFAYGDSTTQGYFANGTNTPADDSARSTYVPIIAKMLNAEYGQIGFGGTNWNGSGVGGAPGFNSSYSQVISGRSRMTGALFTQQPDYISVSFGTNGTEPQSNVATAINNLRTAAPNAFVFPIVPGGGFMRAQITAAVNAKADAKIVTIDAGTRYQLGLGNSGPATDASFDGTHYKPTTYGYLSTEWGQQMKRAITSVYTLRFS